MLQPAIITKGKEECTQQFRVHFFSVISDKFLFRLKKITTLYKQAT